MMVETAPASAAPPLPLEKYATLCAEIDAGGPTQEVLDREGVTIETWTVAQAYWLKRMADEAARKRLETTTRYQAIFKAKRKVFESKMVRAKAKQTDAPPPPVEPLAAALSELDAPMPASIPHRDVPEPPPLTAKPASVATAPPAMAIAPPPMVRSYDSFDAGPMTVAPMTAVPATSPLGSSPFTAPPRVDAPMAVAPWRRGTMEIEMEAVAKNDVPFRPSLEDPNDDSPRTSLLDASLVAKALEQIVPFRDSSPDLDDEEESPRTSLIDPELVAKVIQGAVPFPTAKAASGPFKPSKTNPPRGPLESDDAPKTSILDASLVAQAIQAAAVPFQTEERPSEAPPKTAFYDATQLPKMALTSTMPFNVGDAPPPPPAPPPPAGASPSDHPTLPPPGTQPKTIPAPPPGPNLLAGAPASAPTGSKPGHRLGLNSFASLTAEIADRPADADAIRARYRISKVDHQEESRLWTQEFSQNDDLRQRYLTLVANYRVHLRRGP